MERWEHKLSTNLSPHGLWIAPRCFHPAPCLSPRCQRVPSRKLPVPDLRCEPFIVWRPSVEAAGRVEGMHSACCKWCGHRPSVWAGTRVRGTAGKEPGKIKARTVPGEPFLCPLSWNLKLQTQNLISGGLADANVDANVDANANC